MLRIYFILFYFIFNYNYVVSCETVFMKLLGYIVVHFFTNLRLHIENTLFHLRFKVPFNAN